MLRLGSVSRRASSWRSRSSKRMKLPGTPRMRSCFSPTPSSERLMMSWLSGQARAMRSTLSGMVLRMLLVGMLMMPGRQCL